MKKKIKFFLRFFLILSFFPFVLSDYVFGKVEISEGEGRSSFGPDISENKACDKALENAKRDAIRKVTGEEISSEEQAICDDTDDPTQCRYNSYVQSYLRGHLGRFIGKPEREIIKELGQRTCIIRLKAEVRIREGKSDPSFKAKVKLNRKTFRHGDNLVITVDPLSPMYIYIFQFLPYSKKKEKVHRLVPDPTGGYKKNNLIKTTTVIPDPDNKIELLLKFPDNVKNKDSVDEHLIVVMTKTEQTFHSSYTINGLKKDLLAIPANEVMEIQKIYKLLKK